MDRVVFDSSVWVSSAAYPGSVPDQAIELARLEIVQSICSDPIIDQVRRALASRRFAHLPPGNTANSLLEMRLLSQMVDPAFTLAVITAKESDNRILECAVAGRADLIVTGDRRHLLPLGAFRGIAIVSPADFLVGR